MNPSLQFLLLLTLTLTPLSSGGILKLGVNYGQLGDDLPPPSAAVKLIRSLGAGSVKIYDANSTILSALAGTHLAVSVMVPNELIPSLAGNTSAADTWVSANILPFIRNRRTRVNIRYLLVGNEILSDISVSKTIWPFLIPAMNNLHSVLRNSRVGNIKLGTTVAMDSITTISPPSAAAFRPDIAESVIKPLLQFINGTNSYFFLDAYAYFPWAANYSTINLNYALFEGDSTKNYYKDPVSKLVYTNLLDQQLDSVISAMSKLGYSNIKLFIAETGWPHGGDYDQIGANIRNAAIYNRNLATKVSRAIGTPMRPGVKIPAFIFALFDENMKGGPGTERHWGLYYPNGTHIYDVDLTGEKPPSSYPPLPAAMNNEPFKGKIWCVLKGEKKNATAEIGAALSYACSQGAGICEAVQPGGECYQPNTLQAHASVAFNAYWQRTRNSGGTCFFNGLAEQTLLDPSYGSCKFQSSSS